MAKIDVERFICSIIEAFPAFKEDGTVPVMYEKALADQGLEYRNWKLVERAGKQQQPYNYSNATIAKVDFAGRPVVDVDEMVADFCSQPFSKTRSIASVYRQGIKDVLCKLNHGMSHSDNDKDWFSERIYL